MTRQAQGRPERADGSRLIRGRVSSPRSPRYFYHGYRLENARWSLVSTFGAIEIVRAEPFDAIELELGRLWADPSS